MTLDDLVRNAMEGQRQRREDWRRRVLGLIPTLINEEDGSGKLCQFNPPWREPLWLAGTLYGAGPEYVALANKMVARYGDASANDGHNFGVVSHKLTSLDFNIFNATICCHLLNVHGDQADAAARAVLEYQTRLALQTYGGAGAADYNFQGCNDNMPFMSARGLILGGEALGVEPAVAQGRWRLRQLARHYARCAWLSEYNSTTYSTVSLMAATQIRNHARDPECRALVEKILERLWAEVLLHYHPATFMQSGPQCRAYAVDAAGHTHSFSTIMHLVFGPELIGRDLVTSVFEPDRVEIQHFGGCHYQSIAEYSDFIDNHYEVPTRLLPLVTERRYPARVAGRTEMMASYTGAASETHTRNYMTDTYSLGTSGAPLITGAQTMNFFATYRLRSPARSFRDAATIYCRYRTDELLPPGHPDHAVDGGFTTEAFIPNQGLVYANSHDNTALVSTFMDTAKAIESSSLKLHLLFPAHFGKIENWILGDVPNGAESVAVAPASLAAGEVFIHVQPLIPTGFARRAAVRFLESNRYQYLEMVNYEGPARMFSPDELAVMVNGFFFTIEEKSRWADLATFHKHYSDIRVQDYCFGRRFLRIDRGTEHFELVHSTAPFGVIVETRNGRPLSRPYIESSQIEVTKLPFVTGPVAYDDPAFWWGHSLKIANYDGGWAVGSRGLPGEANYASPVHGLPTGQ